MMRSLWPTAHKYVNYSVGSNTLNSKTQSRLLNSGSDLDGITYSEVANHLTAAVSKMTEHHFS